MKPCIYNLPNLAFVAAALLLANLAEAATYQWTNSVAGDYGNPLNWTNTASPFANGVPGAADTGINNIAGSTTLITNGDNFSVTTLQAQNGNVSVTGGVLNSVNLQVTGTTGNLSISGGAVTNTGDSRISLTGGTINVSGGTYALNKLVLGANSGTTGANMTVSGTGLVIQNQSGSSLHHELWVGGNNGGSGSLLLKDSASWSNPFISGQATYSVVIGNNGSGQGAFTIQDSAVFSLTGSLIRVADLSGNVGTVNLYGGTLNSAGFSKGAGTGTINVNNGSIVANAGSASFFSGFAGTSGNNSVNLVSGSLNFDTGGNTITITNVLSGSGGLTKNGNGTLTLTGANTYSGPTIVNGGWLAVPASATGAGAFTVADNTTFEVQLNAAGKSLTNSSLTLGTSGSLATVFTLGANGTTTTPVIRDNGNLALKGTVTVNVSGTGLSGSTYILISYGSISGSGSFVAGTLPTVAGYTASVINDAANKQLKLVYTPQALPSIAWAVGDGIWDTNTANWKLISNGTSTTYAESNNVTLDDSASGSSPITVTLAGNRFPTSLTNFSSKNYVLAGNFNLNTAALIKDGSGTLILDDGSGNTFAALTIISGTLQLGNNDTNGSLGSVSIVDNGFLAFDRSDNIIITNLISGSGGIAENGPGTVTLAASSTYSGLTTINNGQLILSNNLANSTVSNSIANGLGFASGITAPAIGGLAGSGDISLLNQDSAIVTLTAGGNNVPTSYSGSLSSGNLLKTGTNVLTLSGNSSLNNLQVTANGTLAIAGGSSTVSALQIVANNGAIIVSGGNTTVTLDSRIAGANGIYNVTGGTLNLPKLVIGSAAANNTNNLMTVSGNAVVNQNQPGGSPATALWIGGNNSGSGALLLKDNATWANSATTPNIVVIGNNGTGQGTFTIQDNASFANATVIRVADLAGNVGTVNLNGGTMSVNGFSKGAGFGAINVNGGKISALAPNGDFFNGFTGTSGSNSVNLISGSLTFDTGGNAVTISNVLSGAGGLTVRGNAMLTLAAANTYTGPTIINNGTLLLTSAASINSSSSISNNTSSTLDVSAASSQLAIGGTLAFNDSMLIANFAGTNITVGTIATAGSANTINITALPGITSLPAQIKLVKYSTAAPGLVDGNNVLTTLGAILPATGNPSGYLTNNTAGNSIDLIITDMVLKPVISRQPQPDSSYSNGLAHFSVELFITNSPSYIWRKDGSPLVNAGHVSGANTAVLRLSNVTSADAGNYDVIVTNSSGSVTSSIAPLTVLAPSGYEGAAVAAGPVAFYMFDEAGDPATNNSPAYDFVGDYDGIYGIAAQNGNPNYNIAGPQPGDNLPFFSPTNLAVRFFGFTSNSHVTIPPLNLNTNTVTLTAWIKPAAPAAFEGLIFCRGGGTVAGMNFTGAFDANGNPTLGYTWNNEAGTYTWNSQIAPPPGIWSLVALVITPTNASICILNTNGLLSSSHAYSHVVQAFSANTLIGEDGIAGGNRQFDGTVDDVGIYAKALSQSQLEQMFGAASGISGFAPVISVQPASQNLYEQQTAVFNALAGGSQPLTYQWQTFDGANYFNVTNGGRISGADTATLTITNLVQSDANNFVLVVSNTLGAATSSIVSLTINAASPAEAITNSVAESAGQDWNTGSAWSDGNPASFSAVAFPGSTYFIAPGGGLRTPNTTASTNFPGNILTVQGDGVYNAGAITTAGALILKGQSPGVTGFEKLVMNGGQILSFTDNNNPSVIGGGELNIAANAPIAGLSSTGGRSITITSTLTGNGNIQYVGYPNVTFQPSVVTTLDIAGTNNTYTGTWDVVSGALVGSASNALGTNSINIESAGALQTTYNINNPNGSLILNGRMYLTQDDTFKNVTINGAPLASGKYTYAQLAAAYPAFFPATWTGQTGVETSTTASGSITIGVPTASYPTNMTLSVNGNTLSLRWPGTHLGWIAQSNSVNVANPNLWFDISNSQSGTNLVIIINPATTNVYYRLRHP